MIQVRNFIQCADQAQVAFEIQELPVCRSCAVRSFEGPNHEAILLVHYEIPSKIVQHDGVILIVVFRESGPEDLQRLAVKHAVLLRVYRYHRCVVHQADELVVCSRQ